MDQNMENAIETGIWQGLGFVKIRGPLRESLCLGPWYLGVNAKVPVCMETIRSADRLKLSEIGADFLSTYCLNSWNV